MANITDSADRAEQTRPVRLGLSLLASADQERRRAGRTLSGQVEHWARLGRVYEAFPGLTVAQQRTALDWVDLRPEDVTDNPRVIAALRGEVGVMDLTAADRAAFDDVLAIMTAAPTPQHGFTRTKKGGT